ncbi:uncharacterized protein LOC130733234 [Lotus japonicus]|uniref:uncharacterized protein LOC130733234 n=1 Tax=Lotus japonicus TaxID=34305 RepID=UPI00259087AA|nr:uncharacterized protein LOC130733234 [Lotus japonicus]
MANQLVLLEAHLDGKTSAPRSLVTLNWRDLISSSSTWEDTNYKRTAIASLIQAVYLLEQDRQENRTQENAQAPNFWIPFKYKLTQTLIDERDGSIFGAIFEWDRSAADLSPFRPSGAPRAVLALRGTLLRSPTMRRDIEDDLCFVAWKSLKGSARFNATMDVLKSICSTHGSSNVCIAGHSLGAGFGLQVGQELAKERINVEAHLFNPPAVSLAVRLENIGEMAEYVWNIVKSMLPSGSEAQASNDDKTLCMKLTRLIARLSGLMDECFRTSKCKWVPHLYVNTNDWISFFYIHTDGGTREKITEMRNRGPTDEQNAAKLFVVHKENQKFLEAHGLKQWWSSDAELQQDIRSCKVMSRQLRSLNTGTLSQVILFYYPHSISLAMSVINIRQMTGFVWNVLQSVPPYSISLAMSVINVRQMIDFVWNVLRSVPHLTISAKAHLSCMNDAVYWVCKWVPYLHAGKNDRTGDTMKKFFVVSKEQQKFLAAHGLEQWWPSEKELLAIHNSQLISRQVSSLYTTSWEVMEILNPSSGALSMSFSNIGEREEFVWKWNSLKSMLHSSSEAQVRNDGDNAFGVGFKGWMPQLSSMKDAAYWVYKRVPYLCVSKNGGVGEKMLEKENTGPPNGLITAKLFVVSKEKQKFLAAHGLEQWWPSVHNNQLISRIFRSVYPTTAWEITQLLNPSSVSLAMSLSSIREREEFVCKWNSLLFVPHLSGKAQVIDDGGITSGVGLRGWIPQLSGLKDAAYWVCKWVPNPFVRKNDGAGETMIEKENIGPTNGEITANFFVVSKEQQKFLAAHGLKQWWPSDAELQQAIHNRKIMSRQFKSSYIITPWEVTEVLNPSSGALSMSFSKIGEREEFVWKWNSLRSMLPSSLEAHVSSVGDQTSGLSMKSFMHSFSGLKDAGFAAGKWVPHMYSNCSDYMSWQFGSMYSLTPSQISQLFNLPHVLPSMSLGSTVEKAKFVCNNRLASMCSPSSEAQARNDSDNTSGVSLKSWMPHFSGLKDAFFGMGKFVPYMYANKSDGRGENMDP